MQPQSTNITYYHPSDLHIEEGIVKNVSPSFLPSFLPPYEPRAKGINNNVSSFVRKIPRNIIVIRTLYMYSNECYKSP
jgi:hypothetical protein